MFNIQTRRAKCSPFFMSFLQPDQSTKFIPKFKEMERFSKVVEHWATIYKPMQHTPEKTGRNRRFFLFDSIVSIPQFMSKIEVTKSPCVGFEFHREGNISGGKAMPVYTIYFLVNAGTMNITDKEAADDAVAEAERHMMKFLAWARRQQEEKNELRGLELNNVSYSTYGPFLNNWYSVFLQVRDVTLFNVCVDENDYVEEPNPGDIAG